MKHVVVFAVCVLLLCGVWASGPASAQTASPPIIGPAIVQNGIRFETWLATPEVRMPIRGTSYQTNRLFMLFSIRVTNLLPSPMPFNPYALNFQLFRPGGKEVVADPIMIAGYIRVATEADYLLLQPGQSLVLPEVSNLYWHSGRLSLSWSPKAFPEHPDVYSGLTQGNYEIRLHYKMSSKTVQIRKQLMGKVTKTLNGFWTGNVTLLPLAFQLVKPSN